MFLALSLTNLHDKPGFLSEELPRALDCKELIGHCATCVCEPCTLQAATAIWSNPQGPCLDSHRKSRMMLMWEQCRPLLSEIRTCRDLCGFR